MVQHATTSAALSRSRTRPRRHTSPAPPYAAVRARRGGPTTGSLCAIPRLAPSQAVHAPRRLERRATRRAFLSTGPMPYCPCFTRCDASPLHARRPRRVAVLGSNARRLLRRTVGAIEGSHGEPRVPAGCTPNRDSLHLPLHLL
jgi:hypothetical protein